VSADPNSALILELAWGLSIVALYVYFAMRFVAENERMVIYFDNRPVRVVGPGAVFVWPFIYCCKKLSIGACAANIFDVVLTSGARMPISCTFVFRIADVSRAAASNDDLLKRTTRAVESCLSEVLSAATISQCLTDKVRLECQVADLANKRTEDWGVKVAVVDFGDLQLPRQVLRTIMAQADGISLQLLGAIGSVSVLTATTSPEP